MSVFLSFADEGSSFVYGYLVNGKPFNTFNRTNFPNGTDIPEGDSFQTAVDVANVLNNNGFISGQFSFEVLIENLKFVESVYHQNVWMILMELNYVILTSLIEV